MKYSSFEWVQNLNFNKNIDKETAYRERHHDDDCLKRAITKINIWHSSSVCTTHTSQWSNWWCFSIQFNLIRFIEFVVVSFHPVITVLLLLILVDFSSYIGFIVHRMHLIRVLKVKPWPDWWISPKEKWENTKLG